MNTTPTQSARLADSANQDDPNATAPRAVASGSRHRADLLANSAPIIVLTAAAVLFFLATITATEMLSVYLHGGAAAALACGIGLYVASRLKRARLLRCSVFS